MSQVQSLYKLIILYMLNKAKQPLLGTQITDFFQQHDYTNYFTVQVTFQELSEAGFITFAETHNNTYYSITQSGRETLSYFPEQISQEIRDEIKDYFSSIELPYDSDIQCVANYYKTTGGYNANCQLNSQSTTYLDLTMHVQTIEMAESICSNWRAQSEEVYHHLLEILIK
ncbi:DUF4364 family protein [Eubacterium oxidoreducens]|uniref:DNA-binding transcriptional regulator, PadR family n=1 Tax=Eubacterium oxidoreducens TaxID=1732 RepID=A0A1G6AQK1_EUBOX|nr:DUF4364 family protein [Eubacterium oxidoreducens]SDB10680.1 DNA-binding transcriptional regulator, PadR family [Eubacterium oxidoreducens]